MAIQSNETKTVTSLNHSFFGPYREEDLWRTCVLWM